MPFDSTRPPVMKELLCKIGETPKKIEIYALRIAQELKNWDRLVSRSVHLPLHVPSTMGLVPFVYLGAEHHDRPLQLAKGWRRILGFILQSIVILRAFCVLGLCLDENFHWKFKEYFTGDAALYCAGSLICGIPIVSAPLMHFLGVAP